MSAATPRAAFMFCADDWPDLDESAFQTHEVARALVAAVESSAHNKSDVILGATAVLLGQKGLEAQRADHERIAREGRTPLVVTLAERITKELISHFVVDHRPNSRTTAMATACLPANQAVKDQWWRRGNCRARLRVRSASTPIASRIGIPIDMFDAMRVVFRKAP